MQSGDSRDLPPIAGRLPGLKSRKTYGDRTLFTVEPVAQRAGSVPLRNAPTATTNNQKHVERYFSSAAQGDPAMRGIVGWTKVLEEEKRSFPSTSMWCELMLNKVIKETHHLPQPNALRTAVCCMLLHRLCPMAGHCEQLMSSLLFELFSAVYVDWPEYMARKFVDLARDSRANSVAAVGPAADSSPSLTKSPSSQTAPVSGGVALNNEYDSKALEMPQSGGKFLVAALNQRTTYFSAHETLQKARMHILGAPSRCIGRCINVWIRSLLFAVFHFWRNESRSTKKKNFRTSNVAEKIFLTKSRNRLKVAFNGWRKLTVDHQKLFSHEHTQQKLIQRMGRRIKELEQANISLTDKYTTLLEDHREVGQRLNQMTSMLANFRRPLGDLLGGKSSSGEADGENGENDDEDLSEGDRLGHSSVSVMDVVDPDEAFKSEVYRSNDASLLPKPKRRRRRASSSAAKAIEDASAGGSVQAGDSHPAEVDGAEIEEVTHRPNRVQQLSDFLALDGKTDGVARPSELVPKVVVVEEVKTVVLPNYLDVLDWVSVRTQLLAVTSSTFSKRVSNFTNDFRDSLRLACLLVTLGADKGFFDEVLSTPTPSRAQIVLDAAMCLLLPTDNFYEDAAAVLPVDLFKGKGNKVSRLLFALYDKYKNVAVEVSANHLQMEVMEQLVARNFMKESTKSTVANNLVSVASSANFSMEHSIRSPMSRSVRDEGGLGGDMEATDSGGDGSSSPGDFIPDAQLLHWFRDLAASDSDEDLDNFAAMQQSVLDASSVCGSVAKSMERRLSRSSLSFVRKDSHSAMTPEKYQSWSQSRAKEKRQQLNSGLVAQWMKEKVQASHPELLDPLKEVHPMDALEAVLEAMYPKMTFGGRDLATRVRRMENVIHGKLNLTRVRLQGGKSTETANKQMAQMPVRQLIMFLYLIDRGAVMSK
jgi:hypothetical protein